MDYPNELLPEWRQSLGSFKPSFKTTKEEHCVFLLGCHGIMWFRRHVLVSMTFLQPAVMCCYFELHSRFTEVNGS